MDTKNQIDMEKVRKEATKKVGFLMKGLNKKPPWYNRRFCCWGRSCQQQPTGGYERRAEVHNSYPR
ncbi:Uncharacterised protein [Serratia fonticola]|uniref:Uncharacterized protein n=1 Tax=Serratia fonticola TaxID=47917 RepID=A0A4U9WEH2_SERFO|nr:Uncharacterised protein [Serratia fonticola]VTR57537.1 Uncharacterised protein [Serratia fonticola]